MHDIAEFLRGFDPFNGLDEEALERLARRSEVEFFAAGETIFPQGTSPQSKVRVVRRGAVELVDGGRVVDVLGEGEMFGHPSVLSGLPTSFEARAREDSLCYALALATKLDALSPQTVDSLQRLSRPRVREPGLVSRLRRLSARLTRR
jgi:CBS domain-containing protein